MRPRSFIMQLGRPPPGQHPQNSSQSEGDSSPSRMLMFDIRRGGVTCIDLESRRRQNQFIILPLVLWLSVLGLERRLSRPFLISIINLTLLPPESSTVPYSLSVYKLQRNSSAFLIVNILRKYFIRTSWLPHSHHPVLLLIFSVIVVVVNLVNAITFIALPVALWNWTDTLFECVLW